VILQIQGQAAASPAVVAAALRLARDTARPEISLLVASPGGQDWVAVAIASKKPADASQ
jgi:hypothetical protein